MDVRDLTCAAEIDIIRGRPGASARRRSPAMASELRVCRLATRDSRGVARLQAITVVGSDLTREYVDVNADYRS